MISDQVGMRKPDPDMFAPALTRLGPPGQQCVFVDDVASVQAPCTSTHGVASIRISNDSTSCRACGRSAVRKG
ncbi:MAG: HAD-IA family hydrolase [Pseudonocardiaceae bacterium]